MHNIGAKSLRGGVSAETRLLTDGHRHERHRVVAEDVDHLHGDRVAPGCSYVCWRRRQFELAVLAGPEALPLVLEDVGAGPTFLEVVGSSAPAAGSCPGSMPCTPLMPVPAEP